MLTWAFAPAAVCLPNNSVSAIALGNSSDELFYFRTFMECFIYTLYREIFVFCPGR